MAFSDLAAQDPAGAVDPGARGRGWIIALLTLYYLLLIFEGALRKWALPSYGQWLFFVRDPVVVLIYCLALKGNWIPKREPLLIAGLAFGFLGVLLIGFQASGVAAGIPKWPLLAVYGWRNYFLYIPLPFVVAQVVGERELRRFARLSFVVAIPIAALVLLQFRAPVDAPINVGFGATAAEQFHGLTVDADHTRPSGTFTSDVGQKEFTVTSMAMLLALWIAPARRRFVKAPLRIAATAALLTCLAVSGSRGAMLACGLVVLTAAGSSLVVRGSGSSGRAILLPAALVIGAVVLYPVIFPDGYSAFTNRWNLAQASEVQTFQGGIFGRALYSFFDFTLLLGDAPALGYGIGLAGDAALTLGVVIPGFHGWAESDWARHIVDLGPVVGIGFILYRILLVLWLAKTCLAGARRQGSQAPLLYLASCGLELLYGELTGNGAVNGFAWLFAGLSLAAARMQVEPQTIPAPAPPSTALAIPFPNLMR
jgi:hypothetical protein